MAANACHRVRLGIIGFVGPPASFGRFRWNPGDGNANSRNRFTILRTRGPLGSSFVGVFFRVDCGGRLIPAVPLREPSSIHTGINESVSG